MGASSVTEDKSSTDEAEAKAGLSLWLGGAVRIIFIFSLLPDGAIPEGADDSVALVIWIFRLPKVTVPSVLGALSSR